jgi:two-component system cell cycle sensor histidine kinase/response regulator CckA
MDSAPRILIIDDNPAIHEDFRKILQGDTTRNASLEAVEAALFDQPIPQVKRSSFRLDFASQGKEALAKVQAALAEDHPYALAFVDIRMPPGWDGIETIQHLWKEDPTLQTVICTAYSDYSWEKMTQRLGVNDNLVILKKPFDNVEVLQLSHALTKKWLMTRRAQLRMEQLDRMVAERTAELRRTEERFATAFQSSPVGMAIQTQDGNRFVDANDAFLAILGATRADVIGRSALELLFLVQQSEPEEEKGRVWPARISVRGRDPRDVLVSEAKISVAGEPHVLLLVQDISERLKLEAQLRQAQKMEAIGQLAAGVAHDFNNLLTIIEGHTSLQLAIGQHPPELTQSFKEIEQAAERAADLTRQLLAFSRQQILRPRVLSLNALVDGLLALLKRTLGARVELFCNPDPNLPSIYADQTSIEQIVMNLVINARDAMPEGGRITLETRQVRAEDLAGVMPSRGRKAAYVCLSVNDTGTGMDERTRTHIFEPFFTTKDVNKGTGLGLATVYGIARQHDGWIDVQTAPGAGSTFEVYIPATNRVADSSTRAEHSLSPGQHQTVFLVEDDAAVRQLIREMLEQFDYEVIEAESGDAALARWPRIREKVELLLTDMVMPGDHNGLQLARKILDDKPGLKVIYSSGYSSELFASDVDLVEGQNYLPKPYPMSKLIAIVRQAFQ